MSSTIYDLNMTNENTNYFRNFVPPKGKYRTRRARRRARNVNLKNLHNERIARKSIKYPTYSFVQTLPIINHKKYTTYDKVKENEDNYHQEAINLYKDHISDLWKYLEIVKTKEDRISTIKAIKYFNNQIDRIKCIQNKKNLINRMIKEKEEEKYPTSEDEKEEYVEEEKEELEEKEDNLSNCWTKEKLKREIRKQKVIYESIKLSQQQTQQKLEEEEQIKKALKLSIMTNNVEEYRRKHNVPTEEVEKKKNKKKNKNKKNKKNKMKKKERNDKKKNK